MQAKVTDEELDGVRQAVLGRDFRHDFVLLNVGDTRVVLM